MTSGFWPGQIQVWAGQAKPLHKLTMPYFSLLIILCCAIFYHRLGEAEYGGGWLLALISVGLSVASLFLLHWGWWGTLLPQAGLFVVLWLWNMRSSRRQ